MINYAAALALIPMIAAAFGLSKIICGYFDSTARNPEGEKGDNRRTALVVGLAMIELIGLLSFVMGILLIFF